MENKESYENENVGFGIRPIQSSIIVYPTGEVGDRGFQSCIEHDSKSGHYLYASEFDGFLKKENLGKYSTKFNNIINAITQCKGIVFVYSKYINTGILSLALALEEYGFMQFKTSGTSHIFQTKNTRDDGNNFCSIHNKHRRNMTSSELKKFSQASYIYLSSETSNIDELVRQCNTEENKYGRTIKVILGSAVTGQGLNFKNIRQVHIVEPWYHFNALEQSVGRAIRRESHAVLPEKERNVTVFLHTATVPKTHEDAKIRVETYDERAYRIAYHKKVHMAEVERLLKVNAVDCELLRKGNQYTEKQYPIIRDIVDSFGNSRKTPIYDRENSMICDFQSCEYKCTVSDKGEINTDTHLPYHENDKSSIYREIIKQSFINDSNYTSDGLLEEVKKNADKIGINSTDDEPIIYKCITDMVEHTDIIYNSNFEPGIITAYQDTYVFTPLPLMEKQVEGRKSEKEFRNVSLPVLYRNFPNPMLKNSISQSPDKQIVELDASHLITKKEKVLRDISQTVENIYNDAKQDIETMYASYPQKRTTSLSKLIPTQEELVQYKFMSLIETGLEDTERTQLLISTVEKAYLKQALDEKEKAIIDYYSMPNRQTYIINTPTPMSAIIIYNSAGKVQIYSMGRSNKFEQLDSLSEKWKAFEWSSEVPKDQKIYGWISPKSRGDRKKAFYLYNVSHKNGRAIKVSKKSVIRGSICGTSSRPDNIVDIINTLTGQSIKYEEERKGIRNKLQVCDELELIMRHVDKVLGTDKIRYFYRTEEIYAHATSKDE